MLEGVASLIPALQNIGILHHKKAKLRIHMRQSVSKKKPFSILPPDCLPENSLAKA